MRLRGIQGYGAGENKFENFSGNEEQQRPGGGFHSEVYFSMVLMHLL